MPVDTSSPKFLPKFSIPRRHFVPAVCKRASSPVADRYRCNEMAALAFHVGSPIPRIPPSSPTHIAPLPAPAPNTVAPHSQTKTLHPGLAPPADGASREFSLPLHWSKATRRDHLLRASDTHTSSMPPGRDLCIQSCSAPPSQFAPTRPQNFFFQSGIPFPIPHPATSLESTNATPRPRTTSVPAAESPAAALSSRSHNSTPTSRFHYTLGCGTYTPSMEAVLLSNSSLPWILGKPLGPNSSRMPFRSHTSRKYPWPYCSTVTQSPYGSPAPPPIQGSPPLAPSSPPPTPYIPNYHSCYARGCDIGTPSKDSAPHAQTSSPTPQASPAPSTS